jgi:hypothetical protein
VLLCPGARSWNDQAWRALSKRSCLEHSPNDHTWRMLSKCLFLGSILKIITHENTLQTNLLVDNSPNDHSWRALSKWPCLETTLYIIYHKCRVFSKWLFLESALQKITLEEHSLIHHVRRSLSHHHAWRALS